MTKYTYKLNYNNETFINELKKFAGATITKAECSADCLLVIEADSAAKDDLDEYMSQNGFSYLFETTKELTNARNWGILATGDLPISDVDLGDHVYCSTTKKPMWWDGAKWVDALGN
jgi:hypothetical protein